MAASPKQLSSGHLEVVLHVRNLSYLNGEHDVLGDLLVVVDLDRGGAIVVLPFTLLGFYHLERTKGESFEVTARRKNKEEEKGI